MNFKVRDTGRKCLKESKYKYLRWVSIPTEHLAKLCLHSEDKVNGNDS